VLYTQAVPLSETTVVALEYAQTPEAPSASATTTFPFASVALTTNTLEFDPVPKVFVTLVATSFVGVVL
jgi:hypothetical protein